MHPTLFTIGNTPIPTYTVLLDLGLILSLLLTYLEAKRQFSNGIVGLDLGLWVVVGGIIGARVAYVAANWNVFGQDPARILRIWEGGLSFHGAILSGLLVLYLFSLFHEQGAEAITFWVLGDVLTPGLALGIAFGWAACLMGGCAYGALGEGFGTMILPDIFGIEAPRYATQIASLIYASLLFVGFWLLRGRWPFPGASFLMFGLLYFAGQFLLDFTRGDEAVYVGEWRLTQLVNLALALAAAVRLMVLWWQATSEKNRLGSPPA